MIIELKKLLIKYKEHTNTIETVEMIDWLLKNDTRFISMMEIVTVACAVQPEMLVTLTRQIDGVTKIINAINRGDK